MFATKKLFCPQNKFVHFVSHHHFQRFYYHAIIIIIMLLLFNKNCLPVFKKKLLIHKNGCMLLMKRYENGHRMDWDEEKKEKTFSLFLILLIVLQGIFQYYLASSALFSSLSSLSSLFTFHREKTFPLFHTDLLSSFISLFCVFFSSHFIFPSFSLFTFPFSHFSSVKLASLSLSLSRLPFSSSSFQDSLVTIHWGEKRLPFKMWFFFQGGGFNANNNKRFLS